MARAARRAQWTAAACYHVLNRGQARQTRFHDDEDRCHFLKLLARYRDRFEWRLYHYCLMDNHLLLHLPDPWAQGGPLLGPPWAQGPHSLGPTLPWAPPWASHLGRSPINLISSFRVDRRWEEVYRSGRPPLIRGLTLPSRPAPEEDVVWDFHPRQVRDPALPLLQADRPEAALQVGQDVGRQEDVVPAEPPRPEPALPRRVPA